MPRHRSENELEALRAQAIALEKKIRETEARDRAKRNADEQRRRQIAGAAALEHMAAEPQSAFAATVLGLINGRARSAPDRALFNLPAIPKTSESAPARQMNGGGGAVDQPGT
jgi:hypothetical protein